MDGQYQQHIGNRPATAATAAAAAATPSSVVQQQQMCQSKVKLRFALNKERKVDYNYKSCLFLLNNLIKLLRVHRSIATRRRRITLCIIMNDNDDARPPATCLLSTALFNPLSPWWGGGEDTVTFWFITLGSGPPPSSLLLFSLSGDYGRFRQGSLRSSCSDACSST